MSGYDNLKALLDQADADDLAEGKLAYERYHKVIDWFSDSYGVAFDRTLAAFVALSPNNDYYSNLRSLASVLQWRDEDPNAITVSTYNHCKLRALSYIKGEATFLDTAKGPKIRSFYLNILNPLDPLPVTVDGHMHAAYAGKRWTMKEAIVRPKQYDAISSVVRHVAADCGLIGCQAQATIWFARKRTLGIVYKPQLDLFCDPSDKWHTLIKPIDAPSYPLKIAN
jgi:hypothetical protein